MLRVEPRRGNRLAENVQGVFKRNLLERARAVKQRDGRGEGFKVQKADWILKLSEKSRERGAVNVRFAREQGGALDGLIVGEREVGGNLFQMLDALLE